MRYAIAHLNYLSVLVVAAVGFAIGWLWYSVLFGKQWMAEMKITPEQVQEANKAKGMGGNIAMGFLFTLLGTFGLAALIFAHGTPNWKHGAAYGAFIGVFAAIVRQMNMAVWERKSCKLQLINAGHEFVLYAVQGAILGMWH